MKDIDQEALKLHKKFQGKLATIPLVQVKNKHDLSLVYTPGVAEPSRQIAKNKSLAYDLTWRGRTVAVISNGSAVLGLGNIGAEAALPVMEGKALLLKTLGGIDAVPVVINTQDADEIIKFVKLIAPTFSGILLEDIAAPICFQVEDALQNIGIPVFHDDQHGTAIVCTAALKNAAKVVGKKYEDLHVVIVGAGAAGLATAKMLLGYSCTIDSCRKIQGQKSVDDLIVVDKIGAITIGRNNQNIYKQQIAGFSNKKNQQGELAKIIKDADAVIGLSGPDLITKAMVRSMNKNAIIIAMANPIPEIMPEEALAAGAAIVATGRSDFPNQVNNSLAFPGIFRAVVRGRLTKITQEMKNAASDALATYIKNPTLTNIVPDMFAPDLSEHIANKLLAIRKA